MKSTEIEEQRQNTDSIIRFLLENHISTTEVADSLAKTGEIPMLFPVRSDHYAVGVAKCMFTANGTNFYLHEQINDIKENEIPLIFAKYCEGRAIFGDIIARYILEIKKASAIVVQGNLRDLDAIRDRNYKIWSSGATPVGCVNKPTAPFPVEQEQIIRKQYEDCILVCDGCGVVAIPKTYQHKGMLRRLKALRMQEQVWSYCVDELGWNSLETICEKRYLKEPEKLKPEMRKHLDLLQTDFSKQPTING